MIRLESIVYIYILGYKKKKCKTFFNVKNKNTKRDIKVMKNKFYKKKRHNKWKKYGEYDVKKMKKQFIRIRKRS